MNNKEIKNKSVALATIVLMLGNSSCVFADNNISKDEMNDYDMEKELNSIIKQFRYSQIEEMKEVADTLNN